MENKTKRYYKVHETVWLVAEKRDGKVVKIDKTNHEVTVRLKDGEKIDGTTGKVKETLYKDVVKKMWEIDKLKYGKEKPAKDGSTKNTSELEKLIKSIFYPEVFVAKVKEEAVIPSKRDEDAGYDLYACVDAKEVEGEKVYEIHCPANETTLVPTGVAMALPKTHYLNCKHERGSTGKISLSVLAGVVDSGYRGEIFIAITPLHKDVLITSEVTETKVGEHVILYPYSKAIAQATVDLVPKTALKEISFDELGKIKSERGDTKLGQSGK